MHVFQRELCFELVYYVALCAPAVQAWDQLAISLADAGVRDPAEDPGASQ